MLCIFKLATIICYPYHRYFYERNCSNVLWNDNLFIYCDCLILVYFSCSYKWLWVDSHRWLILCCFMDHKYKNKEEMINELFLRLKVFYFNSQTQCINSPPNAVQRFCGSVSSIWPIESFVLHMHKFNNQVSGIIYW